MELDKTVLDSIKQRPNEIILLLAEPMTADESEVERIECAAIKDVTGIFTSSPPYRHHHIIKDMVSHGCETPIKGEQGFITTHGRFVNRKEAATIALAVGQCKKLHAPPNLFTEDLW